MSEEIFTELKDKLSANVEANKEDEIVQSLEDIKKEYEKMTYDILLKTRIGVVVGRLRKHENATIKALATEITAKWKEIAGVKRPAEHTEELPEKKSRTTVDASPLDNELRKKKRSVLVHALKKSSDYKGKLTTEEAAAELESRIWNHFDNDEESYKNQLCLVYQGLCVAENNVFREKVLNGEDLDFFVNCTVSDLRPESVKKKLQEAKAFYAALLDDEAKKPEVLEGGFKCDRCGSKKVTMTQRQTRSADEPMTCFYECHNCGKKWRQ